MDAPKLGSYWQILDKEGICQYEGKLVSISSGKSRITGKQEVYLHIKKGKRKNVYRTTVAAIMPYDFDKYAIIDPEILPQK